MMLLGGYAGFAGAYSVYQQTYSYDTDFRVQLWCGILFTLIGLCIITPIVVTFINQKILIKCGDKLVGTVTSIDVITNVRVNGRNPKVIVCYAYDEVKGAQRKFRSKYITEILGDVIGKEVSVYVNCNNRNKYYIDVTELRKQEKIEYM